VILYTIYDPDTNNDVFNKLETSIADVR
jgi:hypothetical protein